MAKKKKTLTPIQKKRQLKKKSRLLFGGEIGCIILPFIIMSIVNREEYFVKNEGYRIAIPFIMLITVLVIVLCRSIKKALKLDMFTVFMGLVVADAICFLLREMINDLAYILLFTILGVLAALVLELYRKKKYGNELEIIDEAIKKAKVDNYAEQESEELKKGSN